MVKDLLPLEHKNKHMLISVISAYEELTHKNYLFENSNVSIGDNLLQPWIDFKAYAQANDVAVCTADMVEIEKIDAFVFMDMPDDGNCYFQYALHNKKPMYLIVSENGLINCGNFDLVKQNDFRRVFTYYDKHIQLDPVKYHKLNYSFRLPRRISPDSLKKENFCVVIAGNKYLNSPLELYSERIRAIRWFEKNHPDEFDLYGFGWDESPYKQNFFLRILKKNRTLKKALVPYYPSYRGKVARKHEILQKYKYSICYENVKDIPGWITEKIFDCFFSGCVPVYWGANNVTDYIPTDCFIDRRKFNSYEELYDYIKNMDEIQYANYLKNIDTFLNSKKAYIFSNEYFVKTLLNGILEGNKK